MVQHSTFPAEEKFLHTVTLLSGDERPLSQLPIGTKTYHTSPTTHFTKFLIPYESEITCLFVPVTLFDCI